MAQSPTHASLPDRFEVIRELGRGGMGIVFEVADATRGERVALKTLLRPSPEAVFRLKHEFRTLAELRHPNLVELHELFVTPDSCFFTMELVDGIDFRTAVAGKRSDAPDAKTIQVRLNESGAALDGNVAEPEHDPQHSANVPALRNVLNQLADVLEFLHSAGRVHRDLKPSNLLVRRDGQLAVLDFGLARDLAGGREASLDGIVGTVAYMSPEQCREENADAPADWYAVGCMVYEALTGHPPFSGTLLEVVQKKHQQDPAPPVAADPVLAELCMALLARDPTQRPGAAAVRRLLDAGRTPGDKQHDPISGSPTAAFAGRESELAALQHALSGIRTAESASVVSVYGVSGIGKSSLLQEFLRQTRTEHEDLVVVQGRCFERESVSYQALDRLIDDLSSYWRRLPDVDAAALLPRETNLLVRIFPVLGRVRVIAARPPVRSVADPSDLRSRGFAALREVFQRIADRRRLVIVLDDMQWADANTLDLLADVLRRPDAPKALLIVSSRTEERKRLDSWIAQIDPERTCIQLEPLPTEACLGLAAEQLGNQRELAAQVAAESGGMPIFLNELIRFVGNRRAQPLQGGSLDAMLRDRISAIPKSMSRILEVLAVTGEPTTRAILEGATAIDAQVIHRDLLALTADNLVRTTGRRADDRVEIYHARVRDVVLAELSPEARRTCHRNVAIALIQAEEDDSMALTRHWLAAGEPLRAADQARIGATQADLRLDFNAAAELYALAIKHGAWDDRERRELLGELGGARSRAGLSREAAHAFSQAAENNSGLVALDMQRRAAGELLRGGHLDEGLEAIRKVLGIVGTRLARTPVQGLISLLLRRAWIRIRGLWWRRRSPGSDTPAALTRIDIYNTVGMGLAIVDAIRGADFQCRSLLASLRSGNAERLARALAVEAGYLAAQGATRRARKVGEQARTIARELADSQAQAQVAWGCDGFYAYYVSNVFRDAVRHFEESERLFRAGVLDAGWEIDTVRLFACFSKLYLGELRELSTRVPTYIREAERRGDRYLAVSLRTRLHIVWLIRDDVEGGLAEVEEAIDSWVPWQDGFQVQHFFAAHGRGELALYNADPDTAAAHLQHVMPAMRRSLLLHVKMVGLEVFHLQARIAAARAAASTGIDRGLREKELRELVKRLRRHPCPIGRALVPLLSAALANLRADTDAAIRDLRQGVDALEALDAALYANAAKFRLGQLLRGDEGAQFAAESEGYFDEQGVQNPAKLVSMLVPGWPRDIAPAGETERPPPQ